RSNDFIFGSPDKSKPTTYVRYFSANFNVSIACSNVCVQSIPKIELHAHLNGCIRSSTFRQLLTSSDDQIRLDTLDKNFSSGNTHSRMANVFEKFALLRSCVTNLDDIRRITHETLEDFIDDNVMYVELRTRPRSFDNGKIPSSNYI
ncbi:unnamed protein product, partial [Adineta steineri]